MKSINPIHDEGEISREAEAQNINKTEINSSPLVDTENNMKNVSDTVNQSTENQNLNQNQINKIDTISVYPTPKSYDERMNDREIAHRNTYKGVPVSAFIIASITVVSALYSFKTSTQVLLEELSYDSQYNQIELVDIFSYIVVLAQLLTLTFASYKLMRNSKMALGFITGASFLYVQVYVLALVNNFFKISNLSMQQMTIYGLFVLFLIGLALAWTKDRSRYI